MRLSRLMPCAGLLGFILILAGPAARADLTWTVSLDTSQLVANPTGPFALDFELLGTNGNTVTLTNFSFGGGSAGPGSAHLTGLASGDLGIGSSVSLTDNTVSFFNDFNQQFTPGSTLTFTMDSTLVAPPSSSAPDNFSMVIFSGYDPVHGYNPSTATGGTAIPTTDGNNSTFFNFNINGPGSTTVDSFPSESGDISITVTLVPEPSSGVIVLLSVVCTAAVIFWRRNGVGRRRVVEL